MAESTKNPLADLMGDAHAETLASHWERSPLHASGGADMSDVFSLDTVAELLERPGLPVSCLRLFHDGTPMDTAAFTRRRERGGPGREGLVDGGSVLRRFEEGATVVLEEVRALVPAVDRLAARISRTTGHDTYCAAFLTPPGHSGVPPHYDLASAFLRQVHGSKHWQVGEPELKWPHQPWDKREVALTDPVSLILRRGECLYIPRGHVHAGTATDEVSLHLSIAIKPVTWHRVLQRLLAEAESEEELRAELPWRFEELDRDRLLSIAEEKMEIFAHRCSAEGALGRAVAHLRGGADGGTPTAADAQRLRALSRGEASGSALSAGGGR